MEVNGKLIKKLELETGVSGKGKEWQKQTVIVDTGSEFNNIIAVSAFGDKVERMNKLEVGDNVNISNPDEVTPMLCSNCAEKLLSLVTAVQPSDKTLTSCFPKLIIGSIVKNIPSSKITPVLEVP